MQTEGEDRLLLLVLLLWLVDGDDQTYIVIGIEIPIPGIGIVENVIGILNYFSVNFSITSCNFLSQIIRYK